MDILHFILLLFISSLLLNHQNILIVAVSWDPAAAYSNSTFCADSNAVYPHSCRDIQIYASQSSMKDDYYYIYSQNNSVYMQVFCFGMNTATPKEYFDVSDSYSQMWTNSNGTWGGVTTVLMMQYWNRVSYLRTICKKKHHNYSDNISIQVSSIN